MAPKKKTSRSALAWWLRWLIKPGTWLVLLAVGSVGMMSWLVPELVRDLRAHDEYQYRLLALRVNPAPSWVPSDLVTQVLTKAGLTHEVSLLQPGLAEDLATAFQQHPWVQSVERVQITGRRTVVVQLQYREPLAYIDSLDGALPVDTTGVLLPKTDFAPTDQQRFPLVRGIESFPPDRPGQNWNDPVLPQALLVAKALLPTPSQEYWDRYNLTAIVAPHVATEEELLPHRLTFELETTGGSRIVWGHPPGGDDLEPSVAQKLGRLDQYLRQYGGFEAPRGPYRIDIRNFEAISLQPLTIR